MMSQDKARATQSPNNLRALMLSHDKVRATQSPTNLRALLHDEQG